MIYRYGIYANQAYLKRSYFFKKRAMKAARKAIENGMYVEIYRSNEILLTSPSKLIFRGGFPPCEGERCKHMIHRSEEEIIKDMIDRQMPFTKFPPGHTLSYVIEARRKIYNYFKKVLKNRPELLCPRCGVLPYPENMPRDFYDYSICNRKYYEYWKNKLNG